MKINDLFWTVQGEGANAGRRALFVRMPFCNLTCHWCDTSFNSFDEITEEEFSLVCQAEKARFAVITGGEPSMHKDTPKVASLLSSHGFGVAMETNGMFPIPEGIDWVTVSPKEEGEFNIHPDAYEKAGEVKYVVDKTFDFAILKKPSQVPPHSLKYLSPEFNQFEKNVERILSFIQEFPEWKISLQTHKWMNIK